MSTFHDLLIRLGMDSSGFHKGVDDAEKKAANLGAMIKKTIGTIAIGAIVTKGFFELAGAIEDCVSAAIPLEGIQQSFDGLTASFEGGSKKMLKSLQESSYGMIKQSDLMKSFNTAASLVSKDFAQQLPDAMKYLSKVSAATGQDMNFMMDSLVKGVGRMSPMILDNLGIQVDLASATKRAAEMFGVEESALSKTQQQAGMMAIVLEKLETNTAAMPEVAGTAAQSFAALKVNISNLKEEIGMKLLPVFTAVTNGLTDWISSPAGQKSIDTFIGWVEQVVGDENSGITGIVTRLMNGNIRGALELAFGSDVADWVMRVSDSLKAIGLNLDGITNKAPGTTNVFTILAGAANILGTALESVLLALEGITSIIAAVATGSSIQPIQDKAAEFINRTFPNLPKGPSLYNAPPSYATPAGGWGRASGGPVLAGSSYMVGEHGIEMFTPGVSGSITPNNKLNNGVDMEALLRAVGIDYDRLAHIVSDAVMQVAR